MGIIFQKDICSIRKFLTVPQQYKGVLTVPQQYKILWTDVLICE